MNLSISNHARERFKERWRLGGEIDLVVRNAYWQGSLLRNSLKKTITLLGFKLPNYWTAFYKVYYRMVFVFQPEKEGYTLTTIFPLKWLIDKQREMIFKNVPEEKKVEFTNYRNTIEFKKKHVHPKYIPNWGVEKKA